ncbi:hypothetical protein [Streptomyces sp. NPDC058861]|uniref:hypothetical protein n=1 Tax=Streptomyces sp. NPDC058861 TaxID=3346653 RepID=UPI00368C2AAA
MNKFTMYVVFDAGQIIPEEVSFGFEVDAPLDKVSQGVYEQASTFGIYDDTVPGETRFIPNHRIYTVGIEEVA